MNEQDKEMIHLAAKAAGIECLWELGWRLPCGQTIAWWNPLDDDGDAFRLAVKLMEFEPYKSRGYLPLITTDAQNTRRAIVRAAAEIGKRLFPVIPMGDLPEDDYYGTEDYAYWHDDWPEY